MQTKIHKQKYIIKDNRTNAVYVLEFKTQQHAENFVKNENKFMNKQLEVTNINYYGGREDEEI